MKGVFFFWSRIPVLLLALTLGFPLFSEAGTSTREYILRYDVTAVFEPSGMMEVTEKITVAVAGKQIKRGIFRTIPTIWNRQDGKRFVLDVTVIDVLRNGEKEPYSVRADKDTFKVQIGHRDRMVPWGQHEYTIRYTVRNHFSRFPEWDELYWNVTGNDWAFPIGNVRFKLYYREYAGAPLQPMPVRSIDVYTGYLDEKGKNARVLEDKSIETTFPLQKGQGLTVAWTWSRTVLEEAPDPEAYSPIKKALLPQGVSFSLWIVPLAMLGYFVSARRKRKTGPMPEVIPLFKVPVGMSPGMLRYVVKKNYDGSAFAADILNLVAKKVVELGESAGKPTVKLRKGQQFELKKKLSGTEKTTLSRLFSSKESFSLSKKNSKEIEKARVYLTEVASKEKETLFWPKGFTSFRGYPILLAVPAVSFLLSGSGDSIIFGLFFIFISIWVGVLALLTQSVVGRITSLGEAIATMVHLLFMAPFWLAIAVLCFQFGPLLFDALNLPDGFFGAFGATLLIWIAGSWSLPARTDEGRRRLAIAKGLAMYLGTAERDRFETLYPPEESVEHFEALLPYALALDQGKTWANRFERYLAKTQETSEVFKNASWRTVRHFQTSAAKSSYTPSRSSGGRSGSYSGSGSSGGGSSGRGSGGGGGGGW